MYQKSWNYSLSIAFGLLIGFTQIAISSTQFDIDDSDASPASVATGEGVLPCNALKLLADARRESSISTLPDAATLLIGEAEDFYDDCYVGREGCTSLKKGMGAVLVGGIALNVVTRMSPADNVEDWRSPFAIEGGSKEASAGAGARLLTPKPVPSVVAVQQAEFKQVFKPVKDWKLSPTGDFLHSNGGGPSIYPLLTPMSFSRFLSAGGKTPRSSARSSVIC